MLHPVGSLPPGAYWLRRALVLTLLLMLVLGGWWLFGRGGASGDTGSPPRSTAGTGPSASPSPHTSHRPSPSPTPSHHPSATPTATHAAAATSSPSPSSSATPTCADSAIKVLAVTDASSYATGVKPRLTVQVTNTGDTSCRRDLGQAALTLLVSSGNTRTWSSDDCNPGGGSAVVVLRAHQTFSSTVIWDRVVSRPGCPASLPAAGGSYRLVARNLRLYSAPVPFTLH